MKNKTGIQKMTEWLDNREAHIGKMRRADLRYIRAKAHLLLSEERAQLTEDSLVDVLKKWCQHDIPQEDGQNYDGLQWRAQAQDEVIAIIAAYEQSKERI
jgi:hypothetical protein